MLLSDNNLNMVSHEICVTPYKPLLRTALMSVGIDSLEIEAREEDPGEKEPGVRLASMPRIKGLEFRAVAMCCSQPSDAMNNLKEASIRDRCERYVAATRAREKAVCLGCNELTDLFKAIAELLPSSWTTSGASWMLPSGSAGWAMSGTPRLGNVMRSIVNQIGTVNSLSQSSHFKKFSNPQYLF